MINRSAATQAKGDVVAVDLAGSVDEITTSDSDAYRVLGTTSTIWTSFTAVDASDEHYGILGIVTEVGGIANDKEGEVTFFGVVEEVKVTTAASTNATPGDALVAKSASDSLFSAVTSTQRIVGIYIAPEGTAQSGRLKRVFFNGFTGWGSGIAQS
jgi:hypothetical protein